MKAENFRVLAQQLKNNTPKDTPLAGWFGYLGYGLKNSLEVLSSDKTSQHFPLPALWMAQYRLILVFDHVLQQVTAWAEREEDFAFIPLASPLKDAAEVQVNTVASNMTAVEYCQNVTKVQHSIREGELYQANLTRKFFGTLSPGYSAIDLFRKLCSVSPAPYSALLKLEDCYILSSSPEQFLTLSCDGHISARPIKGSAPRFANPELDACSRTALQHSEKNRAENLMIVDLMRNDFARGCIPGSVKVASLFDVSSYATIHHMSSTIMGRKKAEISSLALIQYCFPPGSMTGAPKIKAMELCSRLEQQERGVYGGAIGWLNGDGAADFSVVIRTLLLKGNRFEFQVGGAIVADSDPEDERQETLHKASAIACVLGIVPETLDSL